MSLRREQFAKWKPGPHHRDPVQETLPFTGAHQWATFKEHPMEEHETVPFMDPRDEKHAEFMPRTPTGRTRPIEHVYRGMSHEEWSQAQKQGRPAVQLQSVDGQAIVGGDSGGGVWLDGQLTAVMWTTVMMENSQTGAQRTTDMSIAAVYQGV